MAKILSVEQKNGINHYFNSDARDSPKIHGISLNMIDDSFFFRLLGSVNLFPHIFLPRKQKFKKKSLPERRFPFSGARRFVFFLLPTSSKK